MNMDIIVLTIEGVKLWLRCLSIKLKGHCVQHSFREVHRRIYARKLTLNVPITAKVVC